MPSPKPLTDQEIKNLITREVQSGRMGWMGFEKDDDGLYTRPSISLQHYAIARAIERAHGIVEINQFETWAKDQGFQVTQLSGMGDGVAYRDLRTQAAWEGFCLGKSLNVS